MRDWNPPALSLLNVVDGTGTLYQLFSSLSRELAQIYKQLEELEKKVNGK